VIRLGAVGLLGFLIDGGLLGALVHLADWNPFSARILSIGVAVFATWLLHRFWTFRSGRKRAAPSQALVYAFVQATGMLINYGVFALVILPS
jgi:putative flippase GtrA